MPSNLILQPILTGNSPTSQQFFDRLMTPPVVARENLYRTLIDTLVAAGVWALLDCLFIFAAFDQVTASIDLVTSRIAQWPVHAEGVFTADRGFIQLGSNFYLDTQFNPSLGTNFVRNSACLFAWNLTTTTQPGFMIGSSGCHISPFLANTHTAWAINSAEVDSGAVAANASGFWLANRTGSASSAVYLNGSSLATSATASTAPDNTTIQAVTNNTCQLAAMGAGAGLSGGQITALYNALQTYLHAVGAV